MSATNIAGIFIGLPLNIQINLGEFGGYCFTFMSHSFIHSLTIVETVFDSLDFLLFSPKHVMGCLGKQLHYGQILSFLAHVCFSFPFVSRETLLVHVCTLSS